MQKPDIFVNFNGVFIGSQEVKRPDYFSVKDWIYFWETVDSFDMSELVRAREEIRNLRHEIADLNHTIEDLKEMAEEVE